MDLLDTEDEAMATDLAMQQLLVEPKAKAGRTTKAVPNGPKRPVGRPKKHDVRSHLPSSKSMDGEFECAKCHRRFPTRRSLAGHIANHTRREQRRLQLKQKEREKSGAAEVDDLSEESLDDDIQMLTRRRQRPKKPKQPKQFDDYRKCSKVERPIRFRCQFCERPYALLRTTHQHEALCWENPLVAYLHDHKVKGPPAHDVPSPDFCKFFRRQVDVPLATDEEDDDDDDFTDIDSVDNQSQADFNFSGDEFEAVDNNLEPDYFGLLNSKADIPIRELIVGTPEIAIKTDFDFDADEDDIPLISFSQHPSNKENQFVECKLCHRHLASMKVLGNHTKLRHKTAEGSFKCTRCPSTFMRLETAVNHVEAIHENKRYECIRCGKQFTYLRGLDLHIRHWRVRCKKQSKKQILEERAEPVTCDICSRQFQTKRMLVAHRLQHESAANLKCQICSVNCDSKLTLKDHYRDNHQTQEGRYRCPKCEQHFQKVSSVVQHVESVHEGKTSRCNRCGKEFSYAASLGKHLQRGKCKQTAVNPTSGPVTCHLCGRSIERRGLTPHILYHLKRGLPLPWQEPALSSQSSSSNNDVTYPSNQVDENYSNIKTDKTGSAINGSIGSGLPAIAANYGDISGDSEDSDGSYSTDYSDKWDTQQEIVSLKCPFCPMVFNSNRALGSHLVIYKHV